MLAFFRKLRNDAVTVRLIEYVDRWSDNPNLPITGTIGSLPVWDVTLQDKDHQSLVDTLEHMGWNWKDGDQYVSRNRINAKT